MSTMYDSVTASDIPDNAVAVAGYANGEFAWSDADWARFPTAAKKSISVTPFENVGDVLDVENGDADPSQAPSWAAGRFAAGIRPTIYCSLSAWPQVIAAFEAQGVAQPDYWIASWDGDPTIPPGAVAKQYANDSMAGGHYDLSNALDSWLGSTTSPLPAHASEPSSQEELSQVERDYIYSQLVKLSHATGVSLDAPPWLPQGQRTYTVKPGDSLSAIALSVYGDASKYQVIYDANKDVIGPDPNLIQPGQILTLPE